MAGLRDQISRGWGRLLITFGLRDDHSVSEERRRNNDLVWAVFGPVLIVAFIWTFAGQTIGLIAVLVMTPFLVVGVRDVTSGRAAARQAEKRKGKRRY